MRAIVRSTFIPFTRPLEGWVTWMYLCTAFRVTTGLGYLIDSPGAALALNWLRPGGARATPDEVRAEWQAVKASTKLAPAGGGRFAQITRLRITDEEVERLAFARLDGFWRHLCSWLPDLPAWPAPAQLAILSMAWGLGPAFNEVRGPSGALMWPKFVAAAKRGDFATCADECKMRGAGSISTRNAHNKSLFLAAGHATDPDALTLPEAA